MNKLARLSAAQRQRIVDDFVERIFDGLDRADPWIRERTRSIGVKYRELAAVIKGEEEPSRRQEEFGWVVAALRAWPDR